MEPTDDIFKLLEGLSLIIGDSRYGAIQKRNYYEEMMKIPKIREIVLVYSKPICYKKGGEGREENSANESKGFHSLAS